MGNFNLISFDDGALRLIAILDLALAPAKVNRADVQSIV